MKPLTNAQIEARKTPAQLKADRGQATQVSIQTSLKRSYSIVRGSRAETNQAEIRDGGNGERVVFSGTYAECVTEAKRRGLWHGSK